jgi:5-methylcytosine-specific restriction endonuclease McrA
MSNNFEIPEEVEARLRRRDKKCVYCGKEMIYPYDSDKRRDSATIEHLNERPPFYWNDGLKEEGLVICCGGCNSSRGKKTLADWFKSLYCVERNINEGTVAKPVKEYLGKL